MKPFVIGALGTVPKGFGKVRNPRTSGVHPNYSIAMIGQNTEKSPGKLEETCYLSDSNERLLVWKTYKKQY